MRHRRSALPFAWFAIPAAVVAVPAAVVWTWWDARPRMMAEYNAWTVAAPACREMTDAEYRKLPELEAPPRSTAFDEVDFTRQTGAMACNRVVNDGGRGFNRHPVCQFSSPGALVVRTGATVRRYDTGPHGATVTVEHGRVSCVLDTHFRPGAWPQESQPS